MVRTIVKFGSKVLRQKATSVRVVDAQIEALVRDLFNTLENAEGVHALLTDAKK